MSQSTENGGPEIPNRNSDFHHAIAVHLCMFTFVQVKRKLLNTTKTEIKLNLRHAYTNADCCNSNLRSRIPVHNQILTKQ